MKTKTVTINGVPTEVQYIEVTPEMQAEAEKRREEERKQRPDKLMEQLTNLQATLQLIEHSCWMQDPLRLHPLTIYVRRIIERCIPLCEWEGVLVDMFQFSEAQLDDFFSSGSNSRWRMLERYINASNIKDIVTTLADSEGGWITEHVLLEVVDKPFEEIVVEEAKRILRG